MTLKEAAKPPSLLMAGGLQYLAFPMRFLMALSGDGEDLIVRLWRNW